MIRRNPPLQQLLQMLALLAIVLAGAVLLAGAIAGTASAQELPGQTNETDDATEVAEQLGDLVVHSYEYDDGEMTIEATWNGNVPETLTATEMIEMDSGGATEISFKQLRLMPDRRQEITMQVSERSSGTAAVLLTTEQSVQNSNALVLQAGDATNRGPVPFSTATILIGAAALGGGGLAFAFTAREHEDDADAERRERLA